MREGSTWENEVVSRGHGSVCVTEGIFSLSFCKRSLPPYDIKGEEEAPLRGSPFCHFEVEH